MPPAPIVLKGQARMLEPIVTLLMAIYTMLEEKDVGTIYGIPVTTFQDQFRFAPQVKLMFRQSQKEIGQGKERIQCEVSFRIQNETQATINEAKALVLAQKIKTKFATGTPFIIQKGKLIVTYLDKVKGYDFRLKVVSEAEGKKVIESVMDLQNDNPEWSRLVVSESKASFPEVPSKEFIYGENRRPPRRRPTGAVPFRYAEMSVWGLKEAITLVDTTGSRPNSLLTT